VLSGAFQVYPEATFWGQIGATLTLRWDGVESLDQLSEFGIFPLMGNPAQLRRVEAIKQLRPRLLIASLFEHDREFSVLGNRAKANTFVALNGARVVSFDVEPNVLDAGGK
jgi:hypothetical protein